MDLCSTLLARSFVQSQQLLMHDGVKQSRAAHDTIREEDETRAAERGGEVEGGDDLCGCRIQANVFEVFGKP